MRKGTLPARVCVTPGNLASNRRCTWRGRLWPAQFSVLQVASQVAEKFHASLIAVHVIPIPSPFMKGYWIQDWRTEARKAIQPQLQKLLPAVSPAAAIEVLEGSPAAARYSADCAWLSEGLA
jgi:hypothetical protein